MATSRFDGLEVDRYLGRFGGSFELEPYEADRLSADMTIIGVVIARVDGADLRIDKRTGDVKRINTLSVQGFAVVDDPALREQLFQHLALQSSVTLDPPAEEEEDDDAPPPWIENANTIVDTGTGEVRPKSDELITVEDEIFNPEAATRLAVGGAGKNDPVLAKFLTGGSNG